MHWYRWQDDTLLLQLHVQTLTHHDEFKGLLDDRLCLRIKVPPVDGKANQYLLALLAKEFKVSKSRMKLIKGAHYRNKCVAIHSPAALPDWFLKLSGKSLKDHGNF
ncbi:MAG: DUF167 family protein [Gammaproteobacteria bacterium]